MISHEIPGSNLPNLDAAILEYFAHVAFDPRLEKLLEDHESNRFYQKSFSTFTSSEYEPYPGVIGFNDRDVDFDNANPVENGQPLTLLNTNGRITRVDGKDYLSLELISDTDPSTRLKIQPSKDGGFYAYKPNDISISLLSLHEVAEISLLANGARPETLDRIAQIENNEQEYLRIIDFVWNRASAISGVQRKVSIMEKEALGSTLEAPIIHRLAQNEITIANYVDNPDPDREPHDETIEIIYEHIKQYLDLEVEEVYRLHLHYVNRGTILLEKDAKKLVRNAGYELEKIAFYHDNKNRTTRQLDPNDPDAMKLFVDLFEELLTTA